jgi:predicted RNA-binding protein YlxR (DUF448 family)
MQDGMIETPHTVESAANGLREDARHRLCALTRQVRPIDELVRFVAGPEDQIVPDLARKLPGRGVWVTGTKAQLAMAIKAKAFERSLKRPVGVPEGLLDQIDALLAKRALEALSLSNKAGALVLGFEKLREALRAGRIVSLVHASDAARDGVDKLDGLLEHSGAPTSIVCFSNSQLSLALGRPNVVHAGLIDAPASLNFIEQTGRLLRYRSG